jgi:hypothetical protein
VGGSRVVGVGWVRNASKASKDFLLNQAFARGLLPRPQPASHDCQPC